MQEAYGFAVGHDRAGRPGREHNFRESRYRGVRTLVWIGAAVLTLLTILNPLLADSPLSSSSGFRPGLSFSRTRPLTGRQQSSLINGLRRLTGFLDITCDDEGFLVLGNRAHVLGGSTTARALLVTVVDGCDAYSVENHERSPELAFARVGDRLDYVNHKSGKGIIRRLRSVEIDFHDYTELRGSPEAIEAFDPALNLLHELAHGAMQLHDSTTEEDPLGDCERYINQIRRELNLPERQSYKPVNMRAFTPYGTGQRLMAELNFARIRPGKGMKTLRLMFDVENVYAAGVVNRTLYISWAEPALQGHKR